MKKEGKMNTTKTQPASQPISKDSSIEHSPKGLKKQDKFLEDGAHIQQKQKLIDQNIRLKTQIFELTRQLEQIMNKQKTNKSALMTKQDDQATKIKKAELKKQQTQVINLKNKINAIKKQLQSVYNNRSLLAKQDELKNLKQQYEALQMEKKSLIKIKQDQSKVLKIIKSQEQYQEKIEELKKQLQAVKEQSKLVNQKLIQSERTLRKNHQTYILKQNKLKQIEQKVSGQQNKKLKASKSSLSVTPQMIKQLQEEIIGLEQERKQNEKTWNEKLALLDNQLKQKKVEQQKKLIILKQKQKQLRLTQLKIKQYQRLFKHNLSASVQPPQEVDMQQFRYKRNIKYMKQ